MRSDRILGLLSSKVHASNDLIAGTWSACAPANASSRGISLLSGKAALRTINSGQQLRLPLANEPGHDVVRPIPHSDLRKALPCTDWLTVRRSGQIAVPQRIPEHPAFIREGSQLAADPAELGLQDRVRVAGNQVHDTLRSTAAREIAGTVQRVEPRISDTGRIPDVMQPGRSNQSLAIQGQGRCYILSLICDTLNMRPSAGQRRR